MEGLGRQAEGLSRGNAAAHARWRDELVPHYAALFPIPDSRFFTHHDPIALPDHHHLISLRRSSTRRATYARARTPYPQPRDGHPSAAIMAREPRLEKDATKKRSFFSAGVVSFFHPAANLGMSLAPANQTRSRQHVSHRRPGSGRHDVGSVGYRTPTCSHRWGPAGMERPLVHATVPGDVYVDAFSMKNMQVYSVYLYRDIHPPSTIYHPPPTIHY
ncbi:hypothetical protein B7494_g8328 [Chlorociboria aeruginascens]|nr:hypothetical protein B7494_g8328 [Chlorociboria aeruginascens]